MNVVSLTISEIVRDMLLQPRAELHRDWIEDYAHDMAAGAQFPPVVVFFDGAKYWLGDGFHRTYAHEAAGLTEILAEVRKGGRRDALLLSCSANAAHGHRRTNEDKRRAVDIMLSDPVWSALTDREIAEACLVHRSFVTKRINARAESVPEPKEGDNHLEPDAEQPLDEWVDAQVEAEAADASDDIEPFDWDASKLRNQAMEAVRALAGLPSPPEVIAAWMKSNSYGEPVETLEQAQAWLTAFLPLYRSAEPRRWARVQLAAQEDAHAA